MPPSPPPPPPPPDPADLARLEAAVARALAEERGGVATARTWPQSLRFAVVLAALAALVTFFFVFLRRADFDVYPQVRYAVVGGSFVVMALAAAWLALRPLWKAPLPAWVTPALAGLGVALPVVAALVPGPPTLYFTESAHSASAQIRFAYYCVATGTISGLALWLALRVVDRSTRAPLDTTLLAALLAGMAGVSALHIECPINYPLHLLIGHAIVPVLFLAVVPWLARQRA